MTNPNKETQKRFDLFLAHSSRNKRQIMRLANLLCNVGVTPWVDAEQIFPGRWLIDEMEKGLLSSRALAVCIGKGPGRWQLVEQRAAIQLAVENGIPVIPVLLPGVPSIPPQLLFLKAFSMVRFSRSIQDSRALEALVRAVTGASGDV